MADGKGLFAGEWATESVVWIAHPIVAALITKVYLKDSGGGLTGGAGWPAAEATSKRIGML